MKKLKNKPLIVGEVKSGKTHRQFMFLLVKITKVRYGKLNYFFANKNKKEQMLCNTYKLIHENI